ncbi:MAG: hypothetical protein AB7V39_00450 [Nitrospiraceae bacterium]
MKALVIQILINVLEWSRTLIKPVYILHSGPCICKRSTFYGAILKSISLAFLLLLNVTLLFYGTRFGISMGRMQESFKPLIKETFQSGREQGYAEGFRRGVEAGVEEWEQK